MLYTQCNRTCDKPPSDAGAFRAQPHFPAAAQRNDILFKKGSHVARRVCVLTSAHPALDVRIFHKECKSLARAGYEVTLIAPGREDGDYDGIALKCLPVLKNRLERFVRGSIAVYESALEVD